MVIAGRRYGSGWCRRLVAGAVVVVAAMTVGVVGRPPVAGAVVSVEPFWMVACSGCTAVVPRDGKPVQVPFGVITTGTVSVATVTLDTSGIGASKVSVSRVEGPCARRGTEITCIWRDVGPGTHTAKVTLRTGPNAVGGTGGSVILRSGSSSGGSSYNSSISGKVEVSHDPSATDIAVEASATSSPIGGTATVTYVVRNNGPSVQPWVELNDVKPQRNTIFVSSNRCTSADGLAQCRVDDLAVGAAVSVRLRYKVTGCDDVAGAGRIGGGFGASDQAYQDTNPFNESSRFQIEVVDCSATATGGSGSPTDAGPVAPAAAPTVAAPGTAGQTASGDPAQSSSGAPVAGEATGVATQLPGSTPPWWLGAVWSILLLLIGMVGLTVVRRRPAGGPRRATVGRHRAGGWLSTASARTRRP